MKVESEAVGQLLLEPENLFGGKEDEQ